MLLFQVIWAVPPENQSGPVRLAFGASRNQPPSFHLLFLENALTSPSAERQSGPEVLMPHLSPQILTHGEQRAILRSTARNRRDHLIYSLVLGTGLRLAEIVGLNVGDVYSSTGKPKNRLRLRPETAKGGWSGDVFLPDAPGGQAPGILATQGHETRGIETGGPALVLAVPTAYLAPPRPVRLPDVAAEGRVRPAAASFSFAEAHSRDCGVSTIEGYFPGAAIRTSRLALDDHGLYPSFRGRTLAEDPRTALLTETQSERVPQVERARQHTFRRALSSGGNHFPAVRRREACVPS